MAGHKKPWFNAERKSQCRLSTACLLFFCSSAFAVYVLSMMATATLTEVIYLTETTCRVTELKLVEEPVPCIIPSCGNILSQSSCRQTGYCLRMTVNFTMVKTEAEAVNMPTVQTNDVPMQNLALRGEYKSAHGLPCSGYTPGIGGDRICRPKKTYDTSLYLPAVGVTANTTTAGADGRVLELIDATDSGPCAAITCREDGNVSLAEARELMTYWPVGSQLQSCHYLRSFDAVDRYLNGGSAPIIMAKTFTVTAVGIYIAIALASFCVSWRWCMVRLQYHHDLADEATNKDFVFGVAGTGAAPSGKNKHRALKSSSH